MFTVEAILMLEEPTQLLPDQWLELIDDFNEKIKRLDRRIERIAAFHEETQLFMSVPGISSFSGLMIHTEVGEIDRFDRANQVVSYAGLDPVVRGSFTDWPGCYESSCESGRVTSRSGQGQGGCEFHQSLLHHRLGTTETISVWLSPNQLDVKDNE